LTLTYRWWAEAHPTPEDVQPSGSTPVGLNSFFITTH
jgi:hypothetical protein